MGDDEALRRRVRLMRPPPDEAQLRQRYAVEAEAMGRGAMAWMKRSIPHRAARRMSRKYRRMARASLGKTSVRRCW